MATVQPGWYADPQNSSQIRFWNGDRWTDQTRPGQSALNPPVTSQYATNQYAPNQYAPVNGATVYGAPAQPGAPLGYGVPGVVSSRSAAPGLWQRNRISGIAVLLCIAYLAIAFSTHFVVLGIAPLLMTIRAFRRREPFAVGALVLTVITLAVSLTALSH